MSARYVNIYVCPTLSRIEAARLLFECAPASAWRCCLWACTQRLVGMKHRKKINYGQQTAQQTLCATGRQELRYIYSVVEEAVEVCNVQRLQQRYQPPGWHDMFVVDRSISIPYPLTARYRKLDERGKEHSTDYLFLTSKKVPHRRCML